MKVRDYLLRLKLLLAAALLVGTPSSAIAQDREPTPIEKLALDKADAALKVKDYTTVRAVLAGPDLAQFPRAHSLLHQLYIQGLGGPKDEIAARSSLRRAAELGDQMSMLRIGEELERAGQPAARAEAKSWFTAASNLGIDHARAHLGRMQWEDGDRAAAVGNWSRGVTDPFARSCLGLAYAAGEGTKAEALIADYQFFKLSGSKPSEGAACVEMAAQLGNSWAQYVAGLWYADKGSKAYDAAKAAKLLGSASEQRHVYAAAKLAEMLDKGDGVPRDANWAFTHYLRAANGGEDRYYARLGDMALAGDGVPRSVSEAVMYYSKDGFGEHQYKLGLIYAGGEGWPRDMTKAVEAMKNVFGDKEEAMARAWLKQQADAGNAHAQYAYAQDIEYENVDTDAQGRNLSYKQSEVAEAKSRDQAYANYKRAAKQNLPEAMYAVASKSMGLSDAETVRMMRGAADLGYGFAMVEMARWHFLGWYGLPRDPAAVRAWHEKAERTGDEFVLASLAQYYHTNAALSTNELARDPSQLLRVRQLYAQTIGYYEAAQRGGYESAAGQLASIYASNVSGVGNPQLEFKWRKAALGEKPSEDEMVALSKMYEAGRGTPVDLLKAWFWAKSAQRYGLNKDLRVVKLWERLTPDQQVAGERLIMTCELTRYRTCTV